MLDGCVAQLGEHLPCKQGVRSSILLVSTILMGLWLSWLERTPDKREVSSSSLLRPTIYEHGTSSLKTKQKKRNVSKSSCFTIDDSVSRMV